MVDYFAMDQVPGKVFFRCDKQRATLSTEACASQWKRADAINDGVHGACRLCQIGAAHAGEVAASMSPLKGSLVCARCHRGATRLIGGINCVSCYNRERELLRGRNAKGTVPVKTCRLDARRIRYLHGDEVKTLALRRTADTDELIISALRISRKEVAFGFNSAPPACVRQARLW